MNTHTLFQLRSAAVVVGAVPIAFGERSDFKLLRTVKSGDLQFGAPAEGIKPLMQRDITVPQTLVLAPKFVVGGVLMNEVEFLIFHNVFFQKRRMRIVGTSEQLESVRAIMQESFFGPRPQDVAHFKNPEVMGYFQKELEYFRGNLSGYLNFVMKISHNRATDGLPTLDHFIELVTCDVGDSVFFKDGQVVFRGTNDYDAVLTQSTHGVYEVLDSGGEKALEGSVDLNLLRPVERPTSDFAEKIFIPPAFGRTIMGSSHGFDPNKRTTSFIEWADGRGIFVDPLVDPKGEMHRLGITEDLVPFVLLTHVHADHDAGTLRMILNGQRVKLLATKLVYESFCRKGRAMGVTVEKFVEFIELKPGKVFDGRRIGMPNLKLKITKGNFHPVPVVGFTAAYAQAKSPRTHYYSCDTFFDPAKYDKLVTDGVMSRERADDLIKRGWDADFIDHEAGVPEIHTDQMVIQTHVEKLGISGKVNLVHTGKQNPGVTLPIAEEGSTAIFVPTASNYSDPLIDAIENNPILNRMSMRFLKVLKRWSQIQTYKRREEIIGQGNHDRDLVLMLKGRASVKKDGLFVATLRDNDFVGEEALIRGNPRSASVEADTETQVLRIPYLIAQEMLKEFPDIAADMERTIHLRPHLSRVSILSQLSSRAMLALVARCREMSFADGDKIIIEGEPGRQFFILVSGQADVRISRDGRDRTVATLNPGEVFGERALLTDSPRSATVVASGSDVRVLAISRTEFRQLMQEQPAVHFGLTQLINTRDGKDEKKAPLY